MNDLNWQRVADPAMDMQLHRCSSVVPIDLTRHQHLELAISDAIEDFVETVSLALFADGIEFGLPSLDAEMLRAGMEGQVSYLWAKNAEIALQLKEKAEAVVVHR